MKLFFTLVFLFLSSSAYAHGGGIDKCGGHNDRKKGGYHVHQQAKYCACNPTAKSCSKRKGKK